MSANVEKMFAVKIPTWHGIEDLLQEPPTTEEAIERAGLDWEVEKKPLFIETQRPVNHPVWPNATVTEYRPVEGRHGIIRSTDQQLLGVVSDTYVPFQNRQAFELFDPFVKDGIIQYECAGSLATGKKVWILAALKRDVMRIKGDDIIKPYILVAMGHDGVTGILVLPTPIRVVCQNTLQQAVSSGTALSIRHTQQAEALTEEALYSILRAGEEMKGLEEMYQAMARKAVTAEQVWSYVSDVLGAQVDEIPEDRSLAGVHNEDDQDEEQVVVEKITRSEAARNKVLELYEVGLGSDMTAVQGTLWGAYNAVIEFTDWHAGKRAKDRANYQLFGDGARLKIRAAELAEQVLKNDSVLV